MITSQRVGVLRVFASFSTETEKNLEVKDGFFESDDGGESWRRVPTPETAMNEADVTWLMNTEDSRVRYRTVSISVSKPYHDYIGMLRQERWFIERSEDFGKSWKRAQANIVRSSETIDRFVFLSFHPGNPKIFYISAPIIGAKTLAGLYVTEDGGENFELRSVGRSLVIFAVSNSNPSVMYSTNEFGSLLKSENSGERWALLDQDREIKTLITSAKTNKGMKDTIDPIGNAVYQIEIDPFDPETVFVLSKKGILKSKDGGANWCVLNLGPGITTAVNSIQLDPGNPAVVFAGTWAGLFRSKGGEENWGKIPIAERLVRK